jgi:CheY-like chemotaxis protein
MLRRLIGENVEFHILPSKSSRPVKIDPAQMQQVVLNLVVNARDAMPQGGRVTVEIADVDLDEEYARAHHGVSPGPHVMLAITDTGCGMTEETKARLFEPFFTTKEKGKGTGLGLSTTYGIVKQSGGHIWVYSEPGYGTCFKVYLPAAQDSLSTVSSALLSPVKSGGETILIAEDEEAILELIRDVLSEHGYRVLVSKTADEACHLSLEEKGEIHLLLTDVVMPELSGKQLAARLMINRPSMKILYMSGYTSDAIVHHGVLDEGIEFLEKPFTPGSLCRKVREVLDTSNMN